MSATLVEAADLVSGIRKTIKLLEAPCGFGCNCTRIAHAEGAITARGRRAPSPSFTEIIVGVNESVRAANAYLADLIDEPGFLDRLRTLRQASTNIGLYVGYIEAIQHIEGDLPAIAGQQGMARNQGRFTDNAGTFVYVAYDEHDHVIYVGVTDDLFGRMAAHRGSKRWWPHMARIEWEEWPDRRAALRKEATLIRRYRPRFNTVGNPDARRTR